MPEIKRCGIYKITSPTNCIYIGQSINITKRWRDHRKRSKTLDTRLYCSFRKHGIEAHKFEIIELCQETELNEKEKYYIAFYNTFNTNHGLNYTKGGDQNSDSIKVAFKDKCAWNKGLKNYISDETRNKIKAARAKQAPMSIEGRIRVSIATKKRKGGMSGKSHTDEARKKIGIASSLRVRNKYSIESRKKMSEKAKINSKIVWDRIRQEKLTMIF